MAMPSTAPDLNEWLVSGIVTDLTNDRGLGREADLLARRGERPLSQSALPEAACPDCPT